MDVELKQWPYYYKSLTDDQRGPGSRSVEPSDASDDLAGEMCTRSYHWHCRGFNQKI